MKTKLPVIALLCYAQLWIGCSAKNEQGADIKGVSTAAVQPGCEFAAADDQFREYRMQPGDQRDISFYLSPEFDQDVTVRPDGNISMLVVGNVRVQGQTPKQLEGSLNQLYSQELKDPKTTVRIDKSPSQVVYVEGQVGKPGAVPLQPGMTAMQAIAASGGMTDAAGASKVFLVRRDACGNAHGQKLKLDKALNQKSQEEDLALAPSDIVVVPRSGVAQFDLNMKQYVRDALPVEPYITPPF